MASKKTVTTGPKYHGKEIRSRAPVDPLAEARGVGERFEDPITGEVIEAEDRIWLRDRPWSRTELLDWVSRDNDGLSPVWPDTGREISKRDLEELYAADAVAMHRDGRAGDAIARGGRVLPSGRFGGGGGFGGGFHGGGGGFGGGGFRGGGLGLGVGLGTGLLVGGALGAGAYGPYGGYGGYYGAPIVDPYYPYGRRRVVLAGHKPEKEEEERHKYMMERLRALHAKRLREMREESESEAHGGRHARNAKGEFTDARGGHHDRNAKGQFTDARGSRHPRNAKGEFTGARTRQAALRDEVMSSLDQDTYHRLYWSMKPEDREAVQTLLREYMGKADLKGRIDDPIESNRLIENGLLPFVDHFTGERGIMPSDAMIYRGRLVSRRGFVLWLEEHKHDEMPPTMFDNSALEREDLARHLNVHPEEYEFFRRRRARRDEDEDGVDGLEGGAKYRAGEATRDDDEMRRRARQYKEDYDAGRIKPTRDEFRSLPFREYLNAEDWSHLM